MLLCKKTQGVFMNTAYKNMRNFWLDVTNLKNRKGVIEIGTDKISIAGVEMAAESEGVLRHLFVATNSLGDTSLYFENNSKSGVGGIIGGHGHEKLEDAAAHMLAYAGKLTEKMHSGKELPSPSATGKVCLFAVSKEKIFYIELEEQEARNPENPFYPFFAYSQQTLSAFKEQEENSSPDGKSARA